MLHREQVHAPVVDTRVAEGQVAGGKLHAVPIDVQSVKRVLDECQMQEVRHSTIWCCFLVAVADGVHCCHE